LRELLDSAASDSDTDCLEVKCGCGRLREPTIAKVTRRKKVTIPTDPSKLQQRANHYRTNDVTKATDPWHEGGCANARTPSESKKLGKDIDDKRGKPTGQARQKALPRRSGGSFEAAKLFHATPSNLIRVIGRDAKTGFRPPKGLASSPRSHWQDQIRDSSFEPRSVAITAITD
jgi:hypothetical protein